MSLPVSSPTASSVTERSPTRPVKAPPKRGTQGGFTAFHGMDVPILWRFLQMAPPMDWRHSLRIASLFFTAPMQSFFNGIESLFYRRAIQRTELVAPPVFVIGHWRSGTTLLQSLMVLDDEMVTPNLSEVLFPGNFLVSTPVLCPLTAWAVPKQRPQDNIPAGWYSPQEDEIGMLALCALTPYLMLAFQNKTGPYDRFFRLSTMNPDEQAEWKRTFLYFLKKLTYRHRKRLSLKSPNHTWRIPALLEMFPGAKFIYIYRHPYNVFLSSMHLRKTMFPENTLATVDHTQDEEMIFRWYMDCFQTYENDRRLIPAGDLHEVKFEDLEVDPYGEMKKLYESLGLPNWDRVDPKLQAEVPKLRKFQKNKFDLDETVRQKVYDRCKPIFDRFGYDHRLTDDL